MQDGKEPTGAAEVSGGTRYTMTEAARIKGVSYHTVSRAVRSGKLPAQRLGRMALIAAEDLKAWRPMRERAPRKYRRAEPNGELVQELPLLAEPALATSYIDRLVLADEQLTEVASAEYTVHFGDWLAQWLVASLRRQAAVIFRVDAGSALVAYGTYGVETAAIQSLGPDRLATALRSMADGTSVRKLDRDAVRRLGAETWFPASGEKHALIVPLTVGTRNAGYAIVFGSGAQEALGEEERHFAQRLGTKAAFAIEHVDLRQMGQKKLLASPEIFDELPLQLLAVDQHGTLVYANKAFIRLWGETVQERYIGRHYSHFVRTFRCESLDGVEVPLEDHPLTRGLNGEPMDEAKYLVPEALGSPHVFSLSTRLTLDEAGGQSGVVLTARDVTDEFEADGDSARSPVEMLADARRRVEMLANLSSEIAEVRDPESIFDIVARRACDILDADTTAVITPTDSNTMVVRAMHHLPESIAGLEVDRLGFPSALMAMARRDLFYVSAEEAGAGGREILRAGNGRVALLVPLLAGDEALGVLAAHYDSVGRLEQVDPDLARAVGRQSGHAVQMRTITMEHETARRRLLMTLDQLPEAIIVLSEPDGQIVAMNREAQAVWGDHSGQHVSDIPMKDEQARELPAQRHPLLRPMRTRRTERGLPLITRDASGNSIDILADVSPLTGRSGELRGAVAVLQRREHFRQIDRAKDEFISVVAHELRNPLTSLRGNLQLLERRLTKMGTEDALREVERVAGVIAQVDRIGDLVSRMMDVSRADLGKLTIDPADTDAVQLAQGAIAEIDGQLEDRVVTLDAPVSLPVQWDGVRVRQILSNLLTNAIRYATEGDIEVTVGRDSKDRVTIAVRDHGPGVPRRLRRRLFRLYYRFDDGEETADALAMQQRGLGIGLYVSARLARAHGGDLRVDDAEGGGAVFTLTLPRIAGTE